MDQWSTDGRLPIEVMTVDGRAVALEFRLRTDLVSVARAESSVAALFDRAVPADWLAAAWRGEAMEELSVDDVCLEVRMPGRIVISVRKGGLGHPAVVGWELSPSFIRILILGVNGD